MLQLLRAVMAVVQAIVGLRGRLVVVGSVTAGGRGRVVGRRLPKLRPRQGGRERVSRRGWIKDQLAAWADAVWMERLSEIQAPNASAELLIRLSPSGKRRILRMGLSSKEILVSQSVSQPKGPGPSTSSCAAVRRARAFLCFLRSCDLLKALLHSGQWCGLKSIWIRTWDVRWSRFWTVFLQSAHWQTSTRLCVLFLPMCTSQTWS